jgi:tRNA 2-thiouridine synthesizing protein A
MSNVSSPSCRGSWRTFDTPEVTWTCQSVAVNADIEIDCRGLKCPLPIIRLANNIGDVPVGRSVAVVADDPAARPDVAAWCRMRAQEYVGEDLAGDGTPRYVVRRAS